MGLHWYARSPQVSDALSALEDVERRIFAPDAHERGVEVAIEEREPLFDREKAARAEQLDRARAVTLDLIKSWPSHVLRHVEALGSAAADRSFLSLLGWEADYYAENLQASDVPLNRFSHPWRSLELSARQACSFGLELLAYVEEVELQHTISKSPTASKQAASAREAGLWLWFWGWVGCRVVAGN
jgi:hypothetical protein